MAHIRKKTLELPNFGPGLNAHRLVGLVAVQMASEMYEVYARDNVVYKALRAGGEITERASRLVFIERVAPRLLEDARQALTDCLSRPDAEVPQAQKDDILEALLKDNDLRAKRLVAEDQATIPTRLH